MTQWVPLYQTSEDVVRSEIATLASVFADVTLWHSNLQGFGYDLVVLGSDAPLEINISTATDRLASRPRLEARLRKVGLAPVERLFGSFTGNSEDLNAWLEGALINSNRSLRLQYLAGRAYRTYDGQVIYQTISNQARYHDIFRGSEKSLNEIRRLARHE